MSLALLIAACGDSPFNKVATGGIFIIELMSVLAANALQWLELFNSTKASINLQGCEITNSQDQATTITDRLVMKALQ